MKKFFINLLFFVLLANFIACTPRARVTPGTIPSLKPSTQSEINKGRLVKQSLISQFKENYNSSYYDRVFEIVKNLSTTIAPTVNPKIWNITILEGDSVKNAAATSGKYVFVWTGMLKEVYDNNELATVLGHELSHVLANHTEPTFAEQLSEGLAGGSGQLVQSALTSSGYGGMAASIAGNIASKLFEATVVNPNSQNTELEADYIGLFLMAKAGYNPNSAVKFWERLANDPDFSSPLSFLSSHPSSLRRSKDLEKYLPQAQILYNNSKKHSSFKVISETTPETSKSITLKPTTTSFKIN